MSKLFDDTKLENIMYLDIETKYLMTDFEGGWKNPDNYGKVRIALLGTLFNGEYQVYEESDIEDLIFEIMVNADLIVGHNIIQFDKRIMKYYFDDIVMKSLQSRIFDTMLEFDKFTGDGGWVSLNDIAQRNFGMKKSEESIKIPQMWREGKVDAVKTYLLNDLKMTEQFYLFGKKGGYIKYDHKVYGKSHGERETFVKW